MKPAILSLFFLSFTACVVVPDTLTERELPFRAIMQGFANTGAEGFWATQHWDVRFAEWSRMG